MTRMCDLTEDLVVEILTRVPITSLRAVRSTCKSWDALSKGCIFGKAASTQQFIGFMTLNLEVYSLRFDLQEFRKDKEDYTSIKQIAIPNQLEISKVFHCDGLVLCVPKNNSSIMVWNPYLGQRRWIEPRKRLYSLDSYALGYDNNRNYKILRFYDINFHDFFEYEIYNFSSNSWSVLDITPDWIIRRPQRSVSLKGRTYFVAQGKSPNVKSFFICFDFTRERFGQLLPLPFDSDGRETVNLSCVRQEKLAVLFRRREAVDNIRLEIWVTNETEPNVVSWSKFLKVVLPQYSRFMSYCGAGSFFIDEEKKVAVVFDVDICNSLKTVIIGEDGYFKSVCVGKYHSRYIFPLISSAYLPSLVQIDQPCKSKEGDA
ncbi:unnamed protein product [Microthlaspi erraticum]|uniref:F-box domain-containing protein n=1 Tax=Microthlaspi erraticum TaxID=1685480 RepID=A0A6D2HAC0_9BRAS|nr:unnamed protein product [Microthlaspi erraticum]